MHSLVRFFSSATSLIFGLESSVTQIPLRVTLGGMDELTPPTQSDPLASEGAAIPPIQPIPLAPSSIAVPAVEAAPIGPVALVVLADLAPPAPPVFSGAPAWPASPPIKRKIWPWVLAGSILAFLLIAGAIIVAVVVFIGQVTGPTATIHNFDKAYKNSDCALFKSTTTTSFQNGFFDKGFDCTQWVSIADGFHHNGVYDYTVAIKSSSISNGTATVTTTEHDTTPGSEKTYDLVYSLVRSNGMWLIDALDNAK